MPRWIPDTQRVTYRAAGEGACGIHHGSVVWTQEAAQGRREALEKFVFRSWIEHFVDGTWKRLGEVMQTPDPTTT
jgi:hypothetical protein